jgi:hypothetical protein
VLFNAHHEPLQFTFPNVIGAIVGRVLDTAQSTPEAEGAKSGEEIPLSHDR